MNPVNTFPNSAIIKSVRRTLNDEMKRPEQEHDHTGKKLIAGKITQ
jgi:hypothetical protein